MSLSSRILLVQRSDRPLSSAAERLEAWGWRCHDCHDGDTMVGLLAEQAFDVILIDPGVDDSMTIVGYLKTQAETKQIPVVLAASEDASSVAAHALALGGDDVIVLPVEDSELYARVRALSRLRRMELERVRRESVLREFGLRIEGAGRGVPAIDKIGILLIGPAGQEQVQVVTALGGAAAVAYAETIDGALERLRRYDLEVAVVTGADDSHQIQRLLASIREDGALYHLPVMLIARPDVFPDRAGPFGWGVSDVLFHPFHPEVLRLRIQGWVRQQRLRRRLCGQRWGETLPWTVDHLTKLYGHGFLHRYLEHQIGESRAVGSTLSVATFSVCGMSTVNRKLGFVRGDRLLAELGDLLGRLIRAEDLPARLDTDRLCVVMDGIGIEEAREVAARIADAARRLGVGAERARPLAVELRAGVAELSPEDDTYSLLERGFAESEAVPLRHAS